MSGSIVLSSANAASGKDSTIGTFRNSPFQNVSAGQISGFGVTATRRLCPPRISNTDAFDQEEGVIAYDQDAERLCYTDSSLAWRSVAIFDELPVVVGTADFVSAVLITTKTIASAAAGHVIPVVGYETLTNWGTLAPFISSTNWSNVTGIYTAAAAGRYKVSLQTSWRETGLNQGIRIVRIIHTSLLLATTTIMCETVTNPSANKKVNTLQNSSAGVLMAVGDTLHVEVAQTSGSDKDVEGGGTIGTSGTTLQIHQV